MEVEPEPLQAQLVRLGRHQVPAQCFKEETVHLAPQELERLAQIQLCLEQVVAVGEDFLLLQQLGLWAQAEELNLAVG